MGADAFAQAKSDNLGQSCALQEGAFGSGRGRAEAMTLRFVVLLGLSDAKTHAGLNALATSRRKTERPGSLRKSADGRKTARSSGIEVDGWGTV